MNPFLLIHGGSHGAWCWADLRRELDSLGRKSYAFDLPGAGYDTTPRANLRIDDSVNKIEKYLETVEESNLIAVFHSLAGLLAAPVFARVPDKFDGFVLLASIVVEKGERAIDYMPEDRRPSYYELAESSGDNSIMLPFEAARKNFFASIPENRAREIYERLTPQPFGPYLERAEFSPVEISIPKKYIVCKRDKALPKDLTKRFAEKAGAEITKIDADHDGMISNPRELASILNQYKF